MEATLPVREDNPSQRPSAPPKQALVLQHDIKLNEQRKRLRAEAQALSLPPSTAAAAAASAINEEVAESNGVGATRPFGACAAISATSANSLAVETAEGPKTKKFLAEDTAEDLMEQTVSLTRPGWKTFGTEVRSKGGVGVVCWPNPLAADCLQDA